MIEIPYVPEFQDVQEITKWLREQFAGRYATALRERDDEIARMLNEKHAPILIPRVTIDPAHASKNLTAASAVAIWAALTWDSGSTATTTSSSFATAVNYVGRGILTLAVVAEVTSGATNVRNGGMRITIDGNEVYSATNSIARNSAWRVVVGRQIDVSGTNIAIIPTYPGLPFNSSCLIEIIGNASGDTITAGWHIAKKL